MRDNVIVNKSLCFAVRIVNMYKMLTDDRKEFVLSKQLLRSGTSIGANISESQAAQSNADFVSKLHVSLKECFETVYWIKLLSLTDYITEEEYDSIVKDALEIKALLTAIIKTAKGVKN